MHGASRHVTNHTILVLPKNGKINKKKNSVSLVRERTIPTERPLPVGEVSANFLRIEERHVVSATDPHDR